MCTHIHTHTHTCTHTHSHSEAHVHSHEHILTHIHTHRHPHEFCRLLRVSSLSSGEGSTFSYTMWSVEPATHFSALVWPKRSSHAGGCACPHAAFSATAEAPESEGHSEPVKATELSWSPFPVLSQAPLQACMGKPSQSTGRTVSL